MGRGFPINIGSRERVIAGPASCLLAVLSVTVASPLILLVSPLAPLMPPPLSAMAGADRLAV